MQCGQSEKVLNVKLVGASRNNWALKGQYSEPCSLTPEDCGGTVVKMLCYKSEGRWNDPSWCHWNFSLTWNPSDRTMVLGSTQPLAEMSTRSISWGKGGRCVRLTTLPPSCAVVTKYGNLNFLESSEPLQACNGTAFFLLTDSWDVITAGLHTATKIWAKTVSFPHVRIVQALNNKQKPNAVVRLEFVWPATVLSVSRH